MPPEKRKRSKPPWNKGLTKDTDERIAKAELKKRDTNLKKYGVENVFQSDEVKSALDSDRHSGELARRASETKQKRYGDSSYNNIEKNRQTKQSRYGDSNYNNHEKFVQTSMNRYGVEHPNQTDTQKAKIGASRIKNKSQEKAKRTIAARYGSLEKYYTLTAMKRYETMRKNGTLGNRETAPEREMYKELCQQYGEDNVIKQYLDKERYPFKCDFYIPSEDLFIELHGFWTHGPHPYDSTSKEDNELLLKLEDEGTDWARACIYTWTDLDVRKLETAKKNGLNYKAIYWYGDK